MGRCRATSDLHEQTSLSTGTVADDDELATNLRHGIEQQGYLESREGGWERGGWVGRQEGDVGRGLV